MWGCLIPIFFSVPILWENPNGFEDNTSYRDTQSTEIYTIDIVRCNQKLNYSYLTLILIHVYMIPQDEVNLAVSFKHVFSSNNYLKKDKSETENIK